MPEIASEHLVTRCQPAIPDSSRCCQTSHDQRRAKTEFFLLFFNFFEFSMKRDQKMCFGSPYPLDCTVPCATSIQIVFARRRQTFGSSFRLRFRLRFSAVAAASAAMKNLTESYARPGDERKNSMSGNYEACLMFRSSLRVSTQF